MKAEQAVKWQDFYEKAWAVRAEYMRGLLKTGKYNTMQIINMLDKKQRFSQVAGATETEENSAGGTGLKMRVIPIKFNVPQKYRTFVGVPLTRISALFGNLVNIPFYTQYRLDHFLIDIIDATGPYDAIVELGCGYGRNLFNIFYSGGPTDICYYGGEFTKSGEELCKDLATATPSMQTQFFHFDHLKPDLSILRGKYERIFVFTVHTIEQVKTIPDEWCKKVAEAAPFVRCVNIEPFGFQLAELGPRSRAHKEFFTRNEWNLNFSEVVTRAKENNEIEVEDLQLENIYSSDSTNMSSVIVWKHGEDKYPPRIIAQ